MSYFSIHNHTDASNIRLKDCINTPELLIDTAINKGLKGICLTDHESLSNHYSFLKHYQTLNNNDFKVGLGNEIYLIDKEIEEEAKENKDKIRFYHFILLAKDMEGVYALRELSSLAWKNSYYYRGMERVPTYKHNLIEIMKKYKGHIIASTACVGGELPQLLLKYNNEKTQSNWLEIDKFVKFCVEVFGKDDFYFELQPSHYEEQKIVNDMLLTLSKHYGIKAIVTTDAHYPTKEDKEAHRTFLESQDGERETSYFYDTTYVMSYDELLEFFDEITLKELTNNTLEIMDKVEEYNLENRTIIPKAILPEWEWKPENYLSKVNGYENIVKMINSQYEVDHYYIKEVLDGIDSHPDTDWTDDVLSRIDLECSELIGLTEQLEQPMSSYFVLMRDLIDIMWTVSLVGPARGSASCWLTNYLIGITQVNALKFKLPHQRFLTKERVGSFPDIDVDVQSSKRQEIIQLIKQKYGEDKVLNVATFGTQKTMRVVDDSCRAFGMNPDERSNFKNLIPRYGTDIPSIEELFSTDNDFSNKVRQVQGLEEAMKKASGLISSRGQHASGVIIFPNNFIKYNALMKAPDGTPTTQYDLHQSEAMGAIKFDILSIKLDYIREVMDILLEQGKIEWQGSLKATYDKYFSINNIDLDNKDIYDELKSGRVTAMFQFDKEAGNRALNKINCKNFDELCAANSLMRLHTDGEEQLIDRYIRFKNDPQEQEDYMDKYHLTTEEKEIIHDNLDERYGVCDTQEYIMQLLMDKRISDYDILEANAFRKVVAGKKKEKLAEQKEKFYNKMTLLSRSKNFTDYIWNELFTPTFGYAFSLPHIVGYSMITLIEGNIALKYGANIWQSAVLNVDSGLADGGNTDFVKVSTAVQKYKSSILPPNINTSKLGFYPQGDKIVYGIKPVVSLNFEDANFIIDNQPYSSLDDFYEKCVINGVLTDRKVINLIKAGMFSDFGDKRQLMIKFISKICPPATRVSKVSTKKLLRYIPKELQNEAKLYVSFDILKKKCNDDMILKYNDFYKQFNINLLNYYNNNKIDKKELKKEVDKNTQKLSNWFKTEEAKEAKTNYDRAEMWNKYCLGSNEQWEFDALNTYIGKSEVSNYSYPENWNITSLSEIPDEPIVLGQNNRGYNIYKEFAIVGTVIDNNSNKNRITVITDDGIIDVKLFTYKYYNEKITKEIIKPDCKKEKVTVDPSWCSKGNNLVLVGYKRNGAFYCSHRNHILNHSLVKIMGKNQQGQTIFKYEKG